MFLLRFHLFFHIAHTKNSSLVTSSCAGMFLCMLEWLSSQVCFMMTCSLITAIQLELLNDQTTQEFVKSLVTTRRKRSQKACSENGRKFVAVARWF